MDGPMRIGSVLEGSELATLINQAHGDGSPTPPDRSEGKSMATSKTAEQIAWELKRPFNPKQLKSRPGPGGKTLWYIDARDVMVRLDEVVGPDRWQTRMRQIGGEVACELSVKYDDEWITKTDGAGETGIEGEKGQFSDALKRAAVLFGVARYLYRDGGHKLTAEKYEEVFPRP